MNLAPPPWYQWLESRLEPAWPLMVVIAVAIIALTVLAVASGKAALLAAWLTYLLMP